MAVYAKGGGSQFGCKESSGRPVTATDESHEEHVEEVIWKIVKLNRKTLLLNWGSLKEEEATLSNFWILKSLCLVGTRKI